MNVVVVVVDGPYVQKKSQPFLWARKFNTLNPSQVH